MADEIVIPVSLDIQDGNETKNAKKIESIIRKRLKSSMNNSIVKDLQTSNDEWETMIRYADKYYKIVGKINKNGTVSKKNYRITPYDDVNSARFEQQQQQIRQIEYSKSRKKDDRKLRFKELGQRFSKIFSENFSSTKTLTPALSRLVNTIKRVGFYRIARNLFRFIENGFKNGINNLVQFDSQANETMSKISTALTKLTSSFTLMLMPLMQILEPIITSISNAISNFAEKISMASASMQGLSKYTKISDKYMEDMANNANSTNLSFDKFESLNAQESPYETAEMT